MIFSRYKLNSFQLARGYLPKIAGTRTKVLTKDLMGTYGDKSASRSINPSIKARNPKKIPSLMLKVVDNINELYKYKNKSVDIKWVTATIEKVREHFVEYRRS